MNVCKHLDLTAFQETVSNKEGWIKRSKLSSLLTIFSVLQRCNAHSQIFSNQSIDVFNQNLWQTIEVNSLVLGAVLLATFSREKEKMGVLEDWDVVNTALTKL